MLVLSRKHGEAIIIGEGPDMITIVLVAIQGDKVRIGIDAPRDVLVDRSEVRERRDGEGWGPGGRSKGPME